ncbi:MAG: Holliday junction resolvase-like protein [Anaerolineales bacterium]
MDLILVLLGAILGGIVAYFVLDLRRTADREHARAQLIERYEAKTQATQSRLIQTYESKLRVLQVEMDDAIRQARQESTDQSRAVLKGKMAEQMAPLLPGFDYLPADARFLGDPVDYVIFDGYTAVKDDGATGDALEVVIIDIKRGRTGLSAGQRQIARAVRDGRVRFEIVRILDDGTVETQKWRSRRRRSVANRVRTAERRREP